MVRKVYVEVLAWHDRNGKSRPMRILCEDGTVYIVERVLNRSKNKSVKVGGGDTRYTIQINGIGVTTIKSEAFYGCSNLSKVTGGENLASVAENAFGNNNTYLNNANNAIPYWSTTTTLCSTSETAYRQYVPF